MARRSAPQRTPRVLSLAGYLRRNSLRRGLLGDNPVWRAVFVVVFGRRLLRRVMGAEPEVIATETLQPGQYLRIAAIDPVDEANGHRKR